MTRRDWLVAVILLAPFTCAVLVYIAGSELGRDLVRTWRR